MDQFNRNQINRPVVLDSRRPDFNAWICIRHEVHSTNIHKFTDRILGSEVIWTNRQERYQTIELTLTYCGVYHSKLDSIEPQALELLSCVHMVATTVVG